MNQAEDLITSILRRNNIPLRAPSSGATPDVPAPEDIDTGNRKRIFKGIKQVTYEEYTNLTEEERKQKEMAYDVKCPVCGTVNRGLNLEETEGRMICERCGSG